MSPLSPPLCLSLRRSVADSSFPLIAGKLREGVLSSRRADSFACEGASTGPLRLCHEPIEADAFLLQRTRPRSSSRSTPPTTRSSRRPCPTSCKPCILDEAVSNRSRRRLQGRQQNSTSPSLISRSRRPTRPAQTSAPTSSRSSSSTRTFFPPSPARQRPRHRPRHRPRAPLSRRSSQRSSPSCARPTSRRRHPSTLAPNTRAHTSRTSSPFITPSCASRPARSPASSRPRTSLPSRQPLPPSPAPCTSPRHSTRRALYCGAARPACATPSYGRR